PTHPPAGGLSRRRDTRPAQPRAGRLNKDVKRTRERCWASRRQQSGHAPNSMSDRDRLSRNGPRTWRDQERHEVSDLVRSGLAALARLHLGAGMSRYRAGIDGIDGDTGAGDTVREILGSDN